MDELLHIEHVIRFGDKYTYHPTPIDIQDHAAKKRKIHSKTVDVKYSNDDNINIDKNGHGTEYEYRIRLYAYCKDCEKVKGYFPDKPKQKDDVVDLLGGMKKRSRDGKIIKQYSSLGFEDGKTPDTVPLEQIDLVTFPKRICNACRYKKTHAGRANPYRQLMQSGDMNRVVSTNLQSKNVVSDPEKFHRPYMICGQTIPDPLKMRGTTNSVPEIMTDSRMYSSGEMVTGIPIEPKSREKQICDTMINGWISDYCIVNNCTRKAMRYGYCRICWAKNNKKCF